MKVDKQYVVFSTSAQVVDKEGFEIVPTLPAGIWNVDMSPQTGGFSLRRTGDRFTVPAKVYGSAPRRVERVWTGFTSTKDTNTGVLCTGSKGAGKSLLSSLICNKGIDNGYPVLVINNKFEEAADVSRFVSFLSDLPGQFIIYMDEFEKNFNVEDQSSFLNILDGGSKTGCLFLMTSNERENVSNFMINRPGRCRYLFNYDGVEESIVEEFFNDNIDANGRDLKKDLEALQQIRKNCSDFSMDIMNSIISEANLFKVSIMDTLDGLNVTPDTTGDCMVDHILIHEDGPEEVIESGVYLTNLLEAHRLCIGDDLLYLTRANREEIRVNGKTPEVVFSILRNGDNKPMKVIRRKVKDFGSSRNRGISWDDLFGEMS